MLPHKYEFIENRFRYILFLIDGLGGLAFAPHRLMSKPLDTSNINSILVMCTCGMGDAVLSTGCIRALKERFPDARMDALAGPRAHDIIKTFPCFENIFFLDNPIYRVREMKRGRFAEAKKVFQDITARKYDLCIDFLGGLANCWASFRSRAKWRIGHTSMGGGFFLTHPVKRDLKNRSIREIMAEALSPLGMEVRAYPMESFYSMDDISLAKKALEEGGYDGRLLAVFAPGAMHQTKTWPPGRFAELADLLIEKRGAFVCLVGSKGDIANAGKVEYECRHNDRLLNLCGGLTLTVTTALIAMAGLFVGNDSGLTHIAASTGTPVVQLFGPGIPEVFGHFGPKDLVFFDPGCRYNPCSPYNCRQPDRPCMERIFPEQVFKGIEEKILSK
ncbi:glycosyltransferase family 9 protein [bacterium]|nr:glycosyltransferase family 9 protein [bacterium]